MGKNKIYGQRKRFIGVLFLMLCLIVSIAAAVFVYNNGFIKKHNNTNNTSNEKSENKTSENEHKIKLTFVGDIMTHQKQLDAAKNSATGEFDFKDNYKYVKSYIESADYAIANLETTLAGAEKGYSGYPVFNTPDSILDALKSAGFDMVAAANNHINDKGKDSFLRTANTIQNSGLDCIGIRANNDQKNYTVKDIKGINVGFTNYVFETAKSNGQKTLNSLVVDKSIENLVNTFNAGELEKNYTEMKTIIDNMKKDGAEFIIFSMHWGDEYQTQPVALQKQMATKIAELGVDLIIGGHPHVLQPVDVIKTSDNREVPIAYSLGNFISNQRYEELYDEPNIGQKAYRTEEGMIFNVNLKKDKDTNKVNIEYLDYVPTWVYRIPQSNGNFKYEVVPSGEAYMSPSNFNITDSALIQRIKNSYEYVIKNTKSMTTNSLLKNPGDSKENENTQNGSSSNNSNNTSNNENKDSILLVNRNNKLDSTYKPKDSIVPNIPIASYLIQEARPIERIAANALEEMNSAAKAAGYTITLHSGYRAYAIQETMYNSRVKELGEVEASKYTAPPGASEHQTGLAVDILTSDYAGSLDDAFGKTNGYKWLIQNCANFGFILRYPENKTAITGYEYEPWHYRYVGVDAAKEIMSKNITLEEYLKN